MSPGYALLAGLKGGFIIPNGLKSVFTNYIPGYAILVGFIIPNGLYPLLQYVTRARLFGGFIFIRGDYK